MILRLDEKHYLKSSLKLWFEVLLYRDLQRVNSNLLLQAMETEFCVRNH